METSLNALVAEAGKVDQYRTCLMQIDKFISEHREAPDTEDMESIIGMWSNMPHRKVYAYTAIVISLYGSLERFIESLVESYVYTIGKRTPKYEQLPDEIRKHHLRKSMDLIEKIQRTGRGNLDVTQIIGNLHQSLSNNNSSALNSEAYSNHTANIRCPVVDELFNNVGVQGICGRARSLAFVGQANQASSVPQWPLIDDLAERRNELSHGMPSGILSLEMLKDYTSEVCSFARQVYNVANGESLRPLVEHSAIALPPAVQVIDHKIVCISNAGHPISVGDYLIAETNDPVLPYRWGRIERIEINKQEVDKVESGPEICIGLQVDMKTKQNHRHYLYRTEH